jgi:hypothetical protein
VATTSRLDGQRDKKRLVKTMQSNYQVAATVRYRQIMLDSVYQAQSLAGTLAKKFSSEAPNPPRIRAWRGGGVRAAAETRRTCSAKRQP